MPEIDVSSIHTGEMSVEAPKPRSKLMGFLDKRKPTEKKVVVEEKKSPFLKSKK